MNVATYCERCELTQTNEVYGWKIDPLTVVIEIVINIHYE